MPCCTLNPVVSDNCIYFPVFEVRMESLTMNYEAIRVTTCATPPPEHEKSLKSGAHFKSENI